MLNRYQYNKWSSKNKYIANYVIELSKILYI